MEETLDGTQLNQSALQSLLGDSTPSLIPESLVTTLTVGFVVLNVLGLLFLVFYIINMVRKWKVESAVFRMQKDLAEIKTALAQPAPSPQPPAAPAQPAQASNVIAQSDDTSTTSSTS